MIYKIEPVTERHIYWHKYSTSLAVIQGTRCTFCIICKLLSPILVYLFNDYRLCFLQAIFTTSIFRLEIVCGTIHVTNTTRRWSTTHAQNHKVMLLLISMLRLIICRTYSVYIMMLNCFCFFITLFIL